jgi:chitodextrinase
MLKKFLMPVLSILLTAALLISTSAGVLPASTVYAAAGTIYYVDSVSGSDENSGTSENAPWKTLAKISGFTGVKPGDQILLKAGSIWNESLDLKCSGDANNQITVGKYGGEARPVINGGGGKFAVRAENIEYITLQDLEITNFNPNNHDDYKTEYHRRSGVWIIGHHYGALSRIQLRNLDIHDITGMSLTGEDGVAVGDDGWVNKNHNAAIMVNAWSWQDNSIPNPQPAYFEDLLIENNHIHDISTMGINIDGFQEDMSLWHKNIIIRNNKVIKTGADNIVVGVATNPLIERNVGYDAGINGHNYKYIAGMWVWKTNGALFQYNEVARVHYESKDTADSAAFDTDILTVGDHIFQYNYSHENEGGFMMNMGQLQNGKNIVRYNISQNDKHNGFSGTTINVSDPCEFYNNIFYNATGEGIIVKDNAKATFINNIFHTTGGNLPYPAGPKFYSNSFFGHVPPIQGVNNIVGDPRFINPGQGKDGLDTLEGYKLKSDSPLIGAGRFVENNGGKDLWGNPLYKGAPDIGAFEAPDSIIVDTSAPGKPEKVEVIDKTDTTVTLSWNAVEKGVLLDGDVYDVSTNKKVASVIMSNTCTVTGLTPDTHYQFHVIARDMSGNYSKKSAVVPVWTTIASVVVDNTQAVATGAWTVDTAASGFYGSNYTKAPAGDGSGSVKWIPTLSKDGYYSVYYWLPNGSNSRASDAPYTVFYDGGSKTYSVNEKARGGSWILLGIHKFKAGTSGYVQLTDQANGEVTADAVKFLYNEDLSLKSITEVVLASEKLQVRIGETLKLTVAGLDEIGRKLDFLYEDVSIRYISDNDAVATAADGVVTGKAEGIAHIKAEVAIKGKTVCSNEIEVIAGPGFTVRDPKFADAYGKTVTSLSPYGVVRTSVMVINSTEDRRKASLTVALYSPKGIVKTDTQEVMIGQYDNATLSVQLALPDHVTGYYVKVFVWDGLTGMHPLDDVTVFPN